MSGLNFWKSGWCRHSSFFLSLRVRRGSSVQCVVASPTINPFCFHSPPLSCCVVCLLSGRRRVVSFHPLSIPRVQLREKAEYNLWTRVRLQLLTPPSLCCPIHGILPNCPLLIFYHNRYHFLCLWMLYNSNNTHSHNDISGRVRKIVRYQRSKAYSLEIVAIRSWSPLFTIKIGYTSWVIGGSLCWPKCCWC